jgi:hypothetical protein
MLRLAIVCSGSLAVAAILTAILLHFRTTRALLKFFQICAIGVAIGYVAAFLVFYRPEIWPRVAVEIAFGIAHIDVDVLAGLGGAMAGMLFTQKIVARRERT